MLEGVTGKEPAPPLAARSQIWGSGVLPPLTTWPATGEASIHVPPGVCALGHAFCGRDGSLKPRMAASCGGVRLQYTSAKARASLATMVPSR